MFDFLKKDSKKTHPDSQDDVSSAGKQEREDKAADNPADIEVSENKPDRFFGKLKKGLDKTYAILNTDITEIGHLKEGLSKTREILNTDITDLIPVNKKIDAAILEDIESQLLIADVGMESTLKIIDDLTQRLKRNQLNDSQALFDALSDNMLAILKPVEHPLVIDTSKKPYVILMVGINGAGKTTTIGKLARQFQDQGLSVMLAAGDTFRAAAVEQLQVWGQRNAIPVIAQQTGADSASVIYDAIEAGKARGIDVVIADTAGRLHTQSNLMDELVKVKRVAGKLDDTAPHEVMLVLDAGTGQNALSQAASFSQAVNISGITLTKMDGTAKGGIIFALANKYQIPLRYIGIGEGIDDLRPFKSEDFVNALLSRDEQSN